MSNTTISIYFDVELLREQLSALEVVNNFYDGTPEDKITQDHLDGIENLLSEMLRLAGTHGRSTRT